MGHFERDTVVEPDGELAFTCRIEPGWWVVAGPNGGYIGAILSRALAAVGGERPAAMAMAVLADDREESLGFDRSEPPEVSPPEELEPTPRPKELPPFGGHFDYRFALGPPPFSGAEDALTGGWLRLSEDRSLDAALTVALTDSWPPAVFTRSTSPLAVPTLDLTVHLRGALPRPGDWVLGRFRTRVARAGFLEEDGELWSRDGELLAQSRQLALAV